MINDPIVIHKGLYIENSNQNTKSDIPKIKNFVFDLDETIGSFSELNIIWQCLIEMSKKNNQSDNSIKIGQNYQKWFNQILDIFPEYLRPGILTIFEFLYHKKQKDCFGNIYIYTNNQCSSFIDSSNPVSWTSMILKYIEMSNPNKKLLFEPPIHAFKSNGQPIGDNKRTSQTKTFADLMRCTLLPKTAEFCFIDNTYFPKMKHGRVFYMQPKPYYQCLGMNEVVRRLLLSDFGKQCVQDFDNSYYDQKSWKTVFLELSLQYGGQVAPIRKIKEEIEMDILVSQKLMYHIKEFFYLTYVGKQRKSKTKKARGRFWYNVSKKLREPIKGTKVPLRSLL